MHAWCILVCLALMFVPVIVIMSLQVSMMEFSLLRYRVCLHDECECPQIRASHAWPKSWKGLYRTIAFVAMQNELSKASISVPMIVFPFASCDGFTAVW